MGFIIKRDKDGAVVAQPGMKKSYTRLVEDMRIFKTREEAEKELCPQSEHICETCL